MAWIEVPKINTKLPILHGTNDETLDWNAGHLYGSSLPVGGESTHSIIVAHSGRPNARLFTDLIKLKTGDVFVTQTLGERMYYQVDNIEVVETVYFGDALKPVEGKDYATLMTCTPTGINSHRLLIRGERIPNPEEDGSKDLATIAPGPGSPWWALAVLGAPTAAWLLLGAVDGRQIRRLVDSEPKETL
ncbi:class C sortase [Leucobacter insecticola]|nr:class C sortase [Leucobacter insecticola]